MMRVDADSGQTSPTAVAAAVQVVADSPAAQGVGKPLGERLDVGVVARLLESNPRTLFCVAHPDDETVGAGGLLGRLSECWIAYLTSGAPRNLVDAHALGFGSREEHAAARFWELDAALRAAGVPMQRVIMIGLDDQEVTASLVQATRRLARLFTRLRPTVVLTHPYEGGHPDHDATCFAVACACRLLARTGRAAPAVIEMTSYHQGPDGWTGGEFLPCEAQTQEVCRILSEDERDRKRRMLSAFATQRQTLGFVPLDFERFRWAPDYSFTRPPHEGTLLYERFPWGMTGVRWRQLAAAATAELFGEEG